MTPQALLADLCARGIELAPDGGRLRYRAPSGTMTPDLRRQLRSQSLRGGRISANGLKRTEVQHFSRKPIACIVESPHSLRQSHDHFPATHVFYSECLPFDKAADKNALFKMDDGGRNRGIRGRLLANSFVPPIDPEKAPIFRESDKKRLLAIPHKIVKIRNSAGQRLERNGTSPTTQTWNAIRRHRKGLSD